jgi:hypothetical protein
VATGVHAKVAVREVTLHFVLEVGDGGLVGDELVCGGRWLAKIF